MKYWELADDYIRNLKDARIRGIKADKELKILHSNRAKRINLIIKKFLKKKNPKTLDVGCGLGEIDIQLAKLGYKITAFDSDKKAVEIAKIGNKEFGTNINFYTDDDIRSKEKFDVVIMNHVVEHVKNPEDILKKVSEVLDRNGILFLTTANKLYLIDPHTGAWFGSWFDDDLFTWGRLKNMLERSGFTAINATSYVLQNMDKFYSSSEHHSPLKFMLFKLAAKILKSESLINTFTESFFVVAKVKK